MSMSQNCRAMMQFASLQPDKEPVRRHALNCDGTVHVKGDGKPMMRTAYPHSWNSTHHYNASHEIDHHGTLGLHPVATAAIQPTQM